MENKKLNFRTLRADEIECRVGTVTDKGVTLLMYKDARCDMRLLDEVVGPGRWKKSYNPIYAGKVLNKDGNVEEKVNLFCTVSIWDEDLKEWVSKQDVGTESNTEKEKGEASDAFKRACVNWGIGRELYAGPKCIWIRLEADEWKDGYNGKKHPKTRFSVSAIEYDEFRRVSYLRIVDDKDRQRYVYGKPKASYDEIRSAIVAINNANTREEIAKVYNSYKNLHSKQEFIDACTKRANEIKVA